MKTVAVRDCIAAVGLMGPRGNELADKARAELAPIKQENEKLREIIRRVVDANDETDLGLLGKKIDAITQDAKAIL